MEGDDFKTVLEGVVQFSLPRKPACQTERSPWSFCRLSTESKIHTMFLQYALHRLSKILLVWNFQLSWFHAIRANGKKLEHKEEMFFWFLNSCKEWSIYMYYGLKPLLSHHGNANLKRQLKNSVRLKLPKTFKAGFALRTNSEKWSHC